MEVEPGLWVNMERAVTPTTRMGGHFVQGHVDGTGAIISMDPEEDSLWVKVKAEKELLKYVVPKDFIAVDGTGLAVVDVFDEEVGGKYAARFLSRGFVKSIKNS